MQINIFYLSQQKRNACYTSQKQNGTIVIALFDIFLPCFLSISFANLISTGVYACSLIDTCGLQGILFFRCLVAK